MNKKVVIPALSFVVFVFIGVLALTFMKPATSSNLKIPHTPLGEQICEKVTAQFGDCKRSLLYDRNSNLVFAESSSGIIPILTNEEFTEFGKFIYPMMDFQEFNEEKTKRGPIDWRVAQNGQKNVSIIYGFAEDVAKTIVINSEANIQPNRFFVRDNLWVWYATIKKEKIKFPIEVTVYDSNGQIINGN